MTHECEICGIEVNPDMPGCSTINGYWVHDDCVIGSEKNLKYMFQKRRR